MLKVLEGFHHQVARRTTGIMAQRMTGGEWDCSPLDEALDTAGLCTIKEYIQ